MDEYLAENGEWLPIEHPLSFRGHMRHSFLDLMDPELAPPTEQIIFPDPRDPEAVSRRIEELGGVDICYGGIGITGHIAFSEPPEPGVEISVEEFAALPTRVLELARETRLYCNRVWQRAIVRRVLHGPVTAQVPCSLVQRHPNASLTMTAEVAQPPRRRLA